MTTKAACCSLAAHHAYYTDHNPECLNFLAIDGVYMTRKGEPLARGHLMEGYAAGSTDEGQWLTVWGSAYKNEVVFGTAEAAEVRADWLRDRAHESIRDSIVVHHVSRFSHGDVTLTGTAFRITSGSASAETR